MKKPVKGTYLLLTTSLLFVLMGQPQKAPSQSLPPAGVPAASNPLQVALLRWYKANLTTSFAVGNQPYGVAFDGANIWTANFGDGTVTKLRASDGAVLGTFKVGGTPYSL